MLKDKRKDSDLLFNWLSSLEDDRAVLTDVYETILNNNYLIRLLVVDALKNSEEMSMSHLRDKLLQKWIGTAEEWHESDNYVEWLHGKESKK